MNCEVFAVAIGRLFLDIFRSPLFPEALQVLNRQQKKIIIIAGPNGAGKTTFAMEFLSNEASCPVFVNADLIAKAISPFNRDRLLL